jgi:hypothetical protein
MSSKLLDYLHVKQTKESSNINPKTFLHEKNIKSAIKNAATDVSKAEDAFNKTDSKITKLLDQRASLLKGEAAYRGLFDDSLNYGTHSTQDLPFEDGDIATLVKMIKDLDGENTTDTKNKNPFIKAINARITETRLKAGLPTDSTDLITNFSEAFLPPFATFPDTNKNNIAKNSEKSKTDEIARGIITGNTNLRAIIARESLFYVLFKDTQTKYLKNVGTLQKTAEGHLDTLNGRLETLQDTIRKYNQLNPSLPMVIPGMISATAGKAAYNAVLSKVQIASANRINTVNSAEANVLLREIAQQLMQHLTNVANTLKKDGDTAKIDLHSIMSTESVKLIDNYRILKGGKTLADRYGALVGATIENHPITLTLSSINKHIKGISTMVKLLSDDGSKKILAVQSATYNKNSAMENLSKIIRRIFSVMDAAFGLSSD